MYKTNDLEHKYITPENDKKNLIKIADFSIKK